VSLERAVLGLGPGSAVRQPPRLPPPSTATPVGRQGPPRQPGTCLPAALPGVV